jgi:hypothetical protein
MSWAPMCQIVGYKEETVFPVPKDNPTGTASTLIMDARESHEKRVSLDWQKKNIYIYIYYIYIYIYVYLKPILIKYND